MISFSPYKPERLNNIDKTIGIKISLTDIAAIPTKIGVFEGFA